MLEPFIAEQGSARGAVPGSEQHCLKSAQQEVTVRDQHGNLFAVSHTGEERQLHSSRPVSSNVFLDETTYLAFPMWFFFCCISVAGIKPLCPRCCCSERSVSITDLCFQAFGNLCLEHQGTVEVLLFISSVLFFFSQSRGGAGGAEQSCTGLVKENSPPCHRVDGGRAGGAGTHGVWLQQAGWMADGGAGACTALLDLLPPLLVAGSGCLDSWNLVPAQLFLISCCA